MLPELLVDLAGQSGSGGLGAGSFKTTRALQFRERDYVAAQFRCDVDVEDMAAALRETEMQLKLRVAALRTKGADPEGYEASGARHIVKTVGFDHANKRVIMKSGGLPLSCLLPEYGHRYARYTDSAPARVMLLLSSIARQVLLGLKFLHSDAGGKLVHSDIKLGNLVIDTKGRVTLIDFGVAATDGAAGVAGTRAYLAPARTQRRTYAMTDDLYALGRTLVYLAQGINMEGHGSQLSLELLNEPKLPDDFKSFVRGLMGEDGSAQFFSAEQALGHAFVARSKTVSEQQCLDLYVGKFRDSLRGSAQEYFSAVGRGRQAQVTDASSPGNAMSDGAAASAAAPASRSSQPDARGAWEEFVRKYPSLIGLLKSVTDLAIEAARLKAQLPPKHR